MSGAVSEFHVVGAVTSYNDYLAADSHIVAERTYTGTGVTCTPGTASWRYFVTDNLGSTAAVTDATGAVVEQDAYDPWGKRRNLNGTDDTACALTSLTTKGFTGHEHIDAACLINENARVYDPAIGRFMTPDTMVSDAMNLQDWDA